MFTGLIKDIGKVKSITRTREGIRLEVYSQLVKDISIDDSVAINGVCQTVIKLTDKTFYVDTVDVSLKKTNLGSLKINDFVNLELALRLSDRLGGHLVQGHVNDLAKLEKINKNGNNYLLSFSINENLKKYIVAEGSITINGVSLTISTFDSFSSLFQVSVIPHTFENTIFKYLKTGNLVNIEVDILAKYVESLIFYNKENMNNDKPPRRKITEDWLRSLGY